MRSFTMLPPTASRTAHSTTTARSAPTATRSVGLYRRMSPVPARSPTRHSPTISLGVQAGGYGGAIVLNGSTNVCFQLHHCWQQCPETGAGPATNGNGGGLYAASSGNTVTNTIIAQNAGTTPDVGVGTALSPAAVNNLIGIGPGSVSSLTVLMGTRSGQARRAAGPGS